MDQYLSAILVIGCLLAIMKFMLGGRKGRIGRPPSGIGTRFLSPSDTPIAAAAMGGYSIGIVMSLVNAQADGNAGILIGAVVAVFASIRTTGGVTITALSVVGFFCALFQMARIIQGEEHDALESIYRLALVLMVFCCFVLATLIFNRGSAFKRDRGLALLGIVDIIGFLARPTGSDLFNLDAVSHLVFILSAGAVAFALGWAASEATLGLVGIAVVGLSVILGGPDGWLGVIAAVSAAGFTAAAGAVIRR